MTAVKHSCSINSIFFNDIEKNTIVVLETFFPAIKYAREENTPDSSVIGLTESITTDKFICLWDFKDKFKYGSSRVKN